jgi:hypothetical protein
MGGQSQTTTSTSQQKSSGSSKMSPPAAMMPYLQGLGNTFSGIETPDISSYSAPALGSATSLAGGQLPPALWDAIQNNVYNTVGASRAAAGRDTMSDGYAGTVAREMTRAAAPYALQGMALSPALASAAAGAPYAGVSNASNFLLPWAQGFGTQKTKGNSMMTGTSQTYNPTDPMQTGVGAGLGLLGASMMPLGGTMGTSTLAGMGLGLLSDRRAKRDIEQVGWLFNGTPIYRYRYLDSDTVHVGLMADEVEEYAPESVTVGGDGLKRVDYMRATQ